MVLNCIENKKFKTSGIKKNIYPTNVSLNNTDNTNSEDQS